ncbi:hypothetical protein AB0B54_35905 [Microbispora bryophytorum]|uniref:hypothetical protein n=1 Tax=Microbispora bryophytorum TaxID=1460882 RepID=UPI0033CE2CE6
MTQDIALDQGWAPAACTLPTAEQPLRVAEFDALFAEAVRAVRRPGRERLRLELVFSPEHAARAAELTARENGCCSFFAFTLTIADGGLTLEVAVPPERIEVLDALQARAVSAAPGPGDLGPAELVSAELVSAEPGSAASAPAASRGSA